MPPVELDTITRIPTEAAHNLKDSSYEPVITRSNTTALLTETVIDDVNTPSATIVTSDDLAVNPIEPTNEVEAYVGGIVDEIASYTLVQTALKTVDFTLDIVEKFVAVSLPSTTKYVQGVRRYLRAVRHAGRRHAGHTGGTFNKKTRSLRDLPSRRRKAMRQASITGYFADLFQLHFILNFLGLELTVADATTKKTKKTSGHVTDDEESTVYKLMKEYDSQDDEDYVPSDSSVDSLEFESDCSDEETTAEQLNKEYVDKDDQDYVPEAASEDSAENIEYNSEAEVSAEESQEDVAEEAEDSQDAEAVLEETEGRKESTSSVESTTVDKLMKDSEDEQEDEDYVPEEVAEDSCEYNSDEEAIKEVIEEVVEVIEEIEDVIEEAIEDVIEEEVTQDSEDDVEDAEDSQDSQEVGEAELVVVKEAEVVNDAEIVNEAEISQESSQDEEAEIVMVKEAEVVNDAEIVNEAEISQESSQDEEAEIVMVKEADISQESSQEADEAEIVMVDEIES